MKSADQHWFIPAGTCSGWGCRVGSLHTHESGLPLIVGGLRDTLLATHFANGPAALDLLENLEYLGLCKTTLAHMTSGPFGLSVLRRGLIYGRLTGGLGEVFSS